MAQSSRNLITLFGMDYEAKRYWFRDDVNFMSMFTNTEKDNLYIEQNIKHGYITLSDDEMYIESFNSIVSEKDKNNDHDLEM